MLGFLVAALTDEPPGRLRGKGDSNAERDRPHPLETEGNSVRPLIIPAKHGLNDTDTDELDMGRVIRNGGHILPAFSQRSGDSPDQDPSRS